MRIVRPLALVLAAGCASARPTGSAAAPSPSPNDGADGVASRETRTRLDTSDGQSPYEFRAVTDASAPPVELPAAPDALFAATQRAYAELGLPMTMTSSSARRVGFENVRARGHVGHSRLEDLVDCGTGAMGMANAARYTVTLSVVSDVAAVSGRTDAGALRTVVHANARPEGESGNAIRCSSTGRIEAQLAKAVALKLGAS